MSQFAHMSNIWLVHFLTGIKKPACGRLLGDWLGLFLVSLASLQNVHPDLRPAVGLGQTLVCRVGRCLGRRAGRCANVGRRILSFAWDSQSEVRFRATSASEIRDLYRMSGPLREQARSHRVQCGLEKLHQVRETAPPAAACSLSTTRIPSPIYGSAALQSEPGETLRPGIRRCCGCAGAGRCQAYDAGI
ncbi:hypothetical protein PS619_02154 [Pseudomonas fluorescens]|nr:hypothetical protein PS619_02154 [Pseudomonas fluorescens]